MEVFQPNIGDYDRLKKLISVYSPFKSSLKEKALNIPMPGKRKEEYVRDVYKKLEVIQKITIEFVSPTNILMRELWSPIHSALRTLIAPTGPFGNAFAHASSLMEVVQKYNEADHLNEFGGNTQKKNVIFEPEHNRWLNILVQELPKIDNELDAILEIADSLMQEWRQYLNINIDEEETSDYQDIDRL